MGKKIGMTQVFTEDGRLVPVTVIEAGPCTVVQKKTVETDGYEAVQVGFGARDGEPCQEAAEQARGRSLQEGGRGPHAHPARVPL